MSAWRALGCAALVAFAGCGSDGAAGSGEPRLVVSAAASLTQALETCSPDFPGAEVRLSFAGSDELAAQIRQGLRPDVYAAANTVLPDELHDEGLIRRPLDFVTNSLVVAVPRDSEIERVEQIAEPGVTLAIGSERTPIGTYTRELLARIADPVADAMLANVRSNEPEVSGIVGKLTQGAADAGFVYASDVEATHGTLRALPLPGELQPTVVYAAAVVDGAPQPALAARYVNGLVEGRCHDALRAAGFGPLK